MFFGEKLKELRLDKAKKGLREFANEIGMTPKELSDIERGHEESPNDTQWIWDIVYALCIQSDMSAQIELINLWKEPFTMKYMEEEMPRMPFHPHDKDGDCLSADKVDELTLWLNDQAVEHNKKARKYNEEHGKNK